MTSATRLFSLLAMVPAMVGPLQAGARSVAVALCSGATANVPISAPVLPGSDPALCCAKGCHTGSSRKRLDRAQ